MRLYLAERVNARWPFLASVLLLGVQGAILSVVEAWHAGQAIPEPEPCPEPEEAPSRGKPGSRPEDLDPLSAEVLRAEIGPTPVEALDPYGFRRGPSW